MLRWILRQLRATHGRVITFREAAELLRADVEERRRDDELIRQAMRDLMEVLRRRKITIYGKRDLKRGEPNPAAEYEPVPHTLFLDELVSLTEWDTVGPDPEHATAVFKYHGPTFRDVRFYASDVLELWPLKPRTDAAAATTEAADHHLTEPVPSTQQRLAIANKPGRGGRLPIALGVLTKWYIQRRDAWPARRKHPSADEDLITAHDKFPDNFISRDVIRAVRAEHAPAAWTTGGRRKLARE
jgi:hypothetical protein